MSGYYTNKQLPQVWEKLKWECLSAFESPSSRLGDHEMIMLLLTFYGYCLKYGLICAGQLLFMDGLWPMLRAKLEYDSDLDISLHLIFNFFSQGRPINSGSLYPCIHVPCFMCILIWSWGINEYLHVT